MFKKAILFLGVAVGLSAAAQAQHQCGSTEAYLKALRMHPEIAQYEAEQERAIQSGELKHAQLPAGTAARGTTTRQFDTTIYYIPVVFHIVHEYGNQDYVPDDAIYQEVAAMNRAFNKTNASQLAGLVPPYNGKIPGTNYDYAANVKIVFYLARKDPNGNPTNGITRRFSYLAGNAGDEAKYDIWATNRYLNIWVIRSFSGEHQGAAAYAYQPFSAQALPYADGPIGLAYYLDYYNQGSNTNTFAHEVGHYFNLAHPWGNTNAPEVACGDDGVDDTPITKGHLVDNRIGGCSYPDPNPNADIYDTVCARGYARTYTRSQYVAIYSDRDTVRDTVTGNSPVFPKDSITVTINYPDTTNAQNIMDYTYCSKMFTHGQAVRMRAALNSASAGRNNLWSFSNLYATGISSRNDTIILTARPDLAPIADFSTNRNFFCANTTSGTNAVTLTDRSWRDTISSRSWTIANSTPSSSSSSTVTLTNVSQPGWVNVSLTANSNAGTSTIAKNNLVYAADPNAISPNGYFQEFNQTGGDVDMYPIFNYYNLDGYKWELNNTRGYGDNTSIMYHNFDPRSYADASTITRTPGGNYSDFYTRAFDLSGSEFSSRCNLTFLSAGAYRTTNTLYMNDTLQISYSTDCGNIWRVAGNITRGNLANRGYILTQFAPGSASDWKLNAISLPGNARTNKVFFRFRFISGTDMGMQTGYPYGTGNDFYLDRINITSNPVGVNTTELAAKGMTLSPNPTSGAATVTLHGGDNSVAKINVTDITGKLVYQTEVRLSNSMSQVEIPANAIAVKGMYMVQAVANGTVQTQKLVVY